MVFECVQEGGGIARRQVLRHAIVAANFRGDNVRLQAAGQSLPDSCADPIRLKNSSCRYVQEDDTVLVNRSLDIWSYRKRVSTVGEIPEVAIKPSQLEHARCVCSSLEPMPSDFHAQSAPP